MSIEKTEKFFSLKIVFVGSPKTGAKTSLVHRYISDDFQETTEPTIVVSYSSKKLVYENVSVRMELWGLLYHHCIFFFCIVS